MEKGAKNVSGNALHIDVAHTSQYPSIISPVSPAPESLDQRLLSENIRMFLEKHKSQNVPTPSPDEIKIIRENKSASTLKRCLAEYRKYADAWRKKSGEKKYEEICGVLEGAIAAGKTTFAAVLAESLEKMGHSVRHHDEKVPAKSLQKYYALLKTHTEDHIPIAAQIQFYIMANRISQFAESTLPSSTVHLQDRFFGDMHFMMSNIRDGISNDEEIETYVSLWSGVCAALPPPQFVLVLEPDANTVVANNRARMENLRETSTKILSVLFCGETSHGDKVNDVERMFPKIVKNWKLEKTPGTGEWENFVLHAIELRDRNGENTLNSEWLKRHAEEYLGTLRVVEDALGDIIQFVHVPYTAPVFPNVDNVIRQINALKK